MRASIFSGSTSAAYRNKPLIRPSEAAIRRIRERLRAELRALQGYNAGAVIRRLNPIIRGWAAYHRTQVSSKTFKMLDQHLWALAYRWTLLSHRNKPRPVGVCPLLRHVQPIPARPVAPYIYA